MNEEDRKRAKKYRKDKVHQNRCSKETRKNRDINFFGYHVTDHAVIRYLDRILNEPVEKYRSERIVPNDKVDKVSNHKKDYPIYIELSNYRLVVINQTVVTVLALESG